MFSPQILDKKKKKKNSLVNYYFLFCFLSGCIYAELLRNVSTSWVLRRVCAGKKKKTAGRASKIPYSRYIDALIISY
jgi:hypothetical protein